MFTRLLLVLALLFAAVPAGAQSSANPASKLAWDQIGQAATVAQTATYRLYIDALPAVTLTSVTCTVVVVPVPSPSDSTCEAPIPAMTPGQHTITVTQGIDGAESTKSPPLGVTFVVVITPSGLRVK